MNIDPASVSTRDLYGWLVQLVTPRPIAWVSTLSDDGIANLAPYSFFNAVGANPPTLLFCPANRRDGTAKDTLANVRQNGQFVVNVVTESMAQAMNRTAAEIPSDQDEFTLASVAPAPSQLVKPPRVAAAAASIECELHSIVGLGTGPGGASIVIGRIVWMHLSEQYIDDDGQWKKPGGIDTVGRMAGNGYVRTTDRFTLERP